MAIPDRSASPSLDLFSDLERDCFRFDFFHAVRRLECAHRDHPRIGQSSRPALDPIRLGQDPSLVFAPSTLSSFRHHGAQRPPRLAGYFFGLFGPNGPLPIHLTEYALDRLQQAHDPTLATFLDLFHHRMLSLFYRAWSLARPTVSYDRPEDDWFGTYVASLIGRGARSLRERDAMPDRAKLYYAGLLACQSHHPDGLVAILGDFFGIPVAIHEFIAEWVAIPSAGRCRLGLSPASGTLASSIVIGAEIWSAQHKFRVVLKSLSFSDYCRFLPVGGSLARLVAVVRNYVGNELDWDVNLVLRREEVPPLRTDGTMRLGWTTWLPAPEFDKDRDDLVFAPLAYGAPPSADDQRTVADPTANAAEAKDDQSQAFGMTAEVSTEGQSEGEGVANG